MDITYHYPADLFNLLIDTLPLLNRGKKDVFVFFKAAGVSDDLMQEPYRKWQSDKNSIGKHDIVRQILCALNEKGERCLRERREVLKRVVEFDSFSSCWPGDELKAKGAVAEVQRIINVKDSFTRMANERECEARLRREQILDIANEKEMFRQKKESLKSRLFALFGEQNHQKRGKELEVILNDLFTLYQIGIRHAFALKGNCGEGICEQIDGVIEIDGHVCFVEMKWWKEPIGVPEISEHLVRVYQRAEVRALVISASDYTAPAIALCKDALQQKVVSLCTLREIVMIIESNRDLAEELRTKFHMAMIEKKPYYSVV